MNHNQTLGHVSALFDELAAHGAPPTDAVDVATILAAANALAQTRQRLLDLLNSLTDDQRQTLLAEGSIAQRIATLRATTDDWTRALSRCRNEAAARINAARTLRRRYDDTTRRR